MAQINLSWLLSLSLSAKNWAECKVQSEHRSAQSSALVSALRLLSSSAVPSARVLGVYHAFLSALFKGDISTLSNKGHFYFGLTHESDACKIPEFCLTNNITMKSVDFCFMA